MNIARDNGFFVTYNHPNWSREGYEQYSKYEHSWDAEQLFTEELDSSY